MKRASVVVTVTLVAAAFPAVSGATFPGDPGRIVFTARAKGEDNVLFDYDLRTRRARQLTHRAPDCARSGIWTDDGGEYSPSGRLIAYLHQDSCAGADFSSQSLWVMRADGRAARMLSPLQGFERVEAGGIAFSPDGRRIAVLAEPGPVQLLLDARTGRVLNRYRWPRGRLESPRIDWGAGGRVVIGGMPPSALWGVSPRGGPFSPITVRRERDRWSSFDDDPGLSPSGASVAFVRLEIRDAWRQEYAGPERYGIWRTSTRKPHRAERIAALGETVVESPVFSPDGRRLAFVTYQEGRIRVMPSRGGGPIRTLRGAPRVRAPGSLTIDWQPRPSGTPH